MIQSEFPLAFAGIAAQAAPRGRAGPLILQGFAYFSGIWIYLASRFARAIVAALGA